MEYADDLYIIKKDFNASNILLEKLFKYDITWRRNK